MASESKKSKKWGRMRDRSPSHKRYNGVHQDLQNLKLRHGRLASRLLSKIKRQNKRLKRESGPRDEVRMKQVKFHLYIARYGEIPR